MGQGQVSGTTGLACGDTVAFVFSVGKCFDPPGLSLIVRWSLWFRLARDRLPVVNLGEDQLPLASFWI